MTEPAEHLPYWSNCENMNLLQLSRFIHDALIRRAKPNVPTDGSTPISHSEFLDLVGLMEAKETALKEDTTISARPSYDGPAAPSFDSDPSHQLETARSKRDDALERLEVALRYQHGHNRTQQLQRELQDAEREVSLIEEEHASRKQDFLRRRHQYEQAREPFERSLSAWKQEEAKASRRQEANEKRQTFVDRSRIRVKEAFRPKHNSGIQAPITVDFEILPENQQTDVYVRRYYREVMSQGWLKDFSQDRLDKMLALPRSNWKKGKEGFFGYMVLMFDHTDRVLLECPVEGNAIYVLNSGEDRLLRKL